MAKKKNNLMLLAGAAAVAAYFIFKKKPEDPKTAVQSGAAITNLRKAMLKKPTSLLKAGMGRGRNLDINGNSPIF